jgi:hypothetical protein
LARERAGKQVGLYQDLKSVADSDDRFAGVDEAANGITEVVDDLIGEDFAGGDVVAVAEAAGENEDLTIAEDGRGFENAVDMHELRSCSGQLECVGGLRIAVGAGGSKDQCGGFHGDAMQFINFRCLKRVGGIKFA